MAWLLSDFMFTISPFPIFYYSKLQVYLFKDPFLLPLVNHESAIFVGYPPTYTSNAPVQGHWLRLRLHLSLAHILCELKRARAHA